MEEKEQKKSPEEKKDFAHLYKHLVLKNDELEEKFERKFEHLTQMYTGLCPSLRKKVCSFLFHAVEVVIILYLLWKIF